MARVTLTAVHRDGERRRWMLYKRVIDENRARHHRVGHREPGIDADPASGAAPHDHLGTGRTANELADAAWLYALSRASMRRLPPSVAPRAIAS